MFLPLDNHFNQESSSYIEKYIRSLPRHKVSTHIVLILFTSRVSGRGYTVTICPDLPYAYPCLVLKPCLANH